MMGRLNRDQEQLFYSFCLEEAVPDDHLVRAIAAVLDLSWVHGELGPYYSRLGRPSIDPALMIRMLIVGYVFAIRSERALCREVDPSLEEGVYVQFPGPHYETPAEIGMVRAIGGDLVGMSTTLEAIAAREAGAEVLGLSLVTNLAAGMTGEPLNHEEVLEAGRAAATRMGGLLAKVVGQL